MPKRKRNYHAMFIMGIAFMGTGTTFIVSGSSAGVGAGILGLGIIFFISSVKNKDKWLNKK